MAEGSWVGLDVHARTTLASVLDAATESCPRSPFRREARRRWRGL